MFWMPATAAFLSLAAQAQPVTPSQVTPAQAKQAVERSLPFLQAEGVKWARNRQCMSCHHVGFMVWSLNEARRAGLPVDRAELTQWTGWAVRYGTYKAVFYKLNDKTFTALQQAGLPEKQLRELKKIKQTFATAQNFRERLGKVLSAEGLGKHQETIFETAALPGRGGAGEDGKDDATQGPGTIAAELLLGGAPALTALPEEAAQALVERLRKTQLKDGSWKHGGQFDALNRPARESTEVNTAWNVLALSAYAKRSGPAGLIRARALAYLKKGKPGVSTESLVVSALLAHRLGEKERANTLLEELVRQQLPDGSWSWLKGNKAGDAHVTGEALYALSILGRDHADASVQRARGFLVKTQRADGSWLVSSGGWRRAGRKLSTDPIFSYWGTAWAAIGLLRTQPRD